MRPLSYLQSLFNSPPEAKREPLLSAFACGVIASLKNDLDAWKTENKALRHVETGMLIRLGSGSDGEDAWTTIDIHPRQSLGGDDFEELIQAVYVHNDKVREREAARVRVHFESRLP